MQQQCTGPMDHHIVRVMETPKEDSLGASSFASLSSSDGPKSPLQPTRLTSSEAARNPVGAAQRDSDLMNQLDSRWTEKVVTSILKEMHLPGDTSGSTVVIQDNVTLAPLAVPKTKSTLPKILQEQISFQHQYDSRTSPNEPIRGKRHGAFVWTEIKPVSGPMAPKGIKVFLSAVGSRPPEQPKNEKGSLVEGCVTSPNLCLQNSQQMFDSESHLSKTDLGEAAKIYPRIPAGGQNSSSLSQPAEEDAGHHAREEAFCSATSHPLGDPRGRFPPTIAMSMVLPAPTAVDMKPSVIAQVITLVPPGIHNTRHKLTPMNC
ncbi:uncharacterized protein C2orf73 homolog isoform X2 [Rhinatrema bivittatum]|uniref:uncharacterized protein C2orf73 homolog isoform X2 n=1 Tax=Rhinatrema bivittatum TaxID=194408 RepID=UPI00112813B4|nr:uncharacterized protein C2orf73 homolog isoform X2 [Rhinatrema bivittatum]